MGNDTIHLCIAAYWVLFRAECGRFGRRVICVVNCGILLVVHTCVYCCLHIFYLFATTGAIKSR